MHSADYPKRSPVRTLRLFRMFLLTFIAKLLHFAAQLIDLPLELFLRGRFDQRMFFRRGKQLFIAVAVNHALPRAFRLRILAAVFAFMLFLFDALVVIYRSFFAQIGIHDRHDEQEWRTWRPPVRR